MVCLAFCSALVLFIDILLDMIFLLLLLFLLSAMLCLFSCVTVAVGTQKHLRFRELLVVRHSRSSDDRK